MATTKYTEILYLKFKYTSNYKKKSQYMDLNQYKTIESTLNPQTYLTRFIALRGFYCDVTLSNKLRKYRKSTNKSQLNPKVFFFFVIIS